MGRGGEKLEDFTVPNPASPGGGLVSLVWFGKKLISEQGEGGTVPSAGYLQGSNVTPVYQDRLGTNRAAWSAITTTNNTTWGTTDNGARFLPYGEEITSTGNDHVKFGTYTRDSYTGLDYADQRFYASSYGRFNTADPSAASGGPNSPGSWNRYAYTRGDPVNRRDPQGLEDIGDGYYDDGGTAIPGYLLADGCTNPSLIMAALQSGVDISGNCPQYYSAPIIPVAAPVRSAAPTCSISLYERPTPTTFSPGEHTYIAATINGQSETIEGGPIPGFAAVGGTLTGDISPPGAPLSGYGSGDATNPALPSNKEIGSSYSGPNACADIASLSSWVASYNGGSKATYNFLGIGGYNSNSFTYTLDNQLGLLNYFGPPAGWVPGWGKPVPGL